LELKENSFMVGQLFITLIILNYPKSHHADSKRKLLDVIETGKTRCVNGLNYDPESK
jgi:hypothetical protein